MNRIASISGITEKERIPDSIFEEANQVEFIDLELRNCEPNKGRHILQM